MKRIGLIDNLSSIYDFSNFGYENPTSDQVLTATGGNTGNLAFVYAIRKLIANPIVNICWNTDPNQIWKQCDCIVICCANQLGEHTDLQEWSDLLTLWNLPVILIGIGIQSENINLKPEIKAGTVNFLKTVNRLKISEKSCNISTRGEYTSSFLKLFDIKSVPTGCPSNLISNDKRLGESIFHASKNYGLHNIAVAAGNPFHSQFANLELYLKKIVDLNCGAYIVQHPKQLIQLVLREFNMMSQIDLGHIKHIYNFCDETTNLNEWFRKKATFYVDVPNWMHFLRKFDAIIGPRFHGVSLGIQSGVPGWVIPIDSRTYELAITTGVPLIAPSDLLNLSVNELMKLMRWKEEDAVNIDISRKRAALMFQEFFYSNYLESSAHLNEIISGF